MRAGRGASNSAVDEKGGPKSFVEELMPELSMKDEGELSGGFGGWGEVSI